MAAFSRRRFVVVRKFSFPPLSSSSCLAYEFHKSNGRRRWYGPPLFLSQPNKLSYAPLSLSSVTCLSFPGWKEKPSVFNLENGRRRRRKSWTNGGRGRGKRCRNKNVRERLLLSRKNSEWLPTSSSHSYTYW